jgi:hypothetical protein
MPQACPVSGTNGKPVGWRTVAALSRVAIPPRQEFRLCRESDCGVVYFGAAGTRLGTDELTVKPSFKSGGSDVLCYCFQHRRSDIARELRETGRTTALEAIRTQVQAGNCACEVKNPTGKCCLGEVQRAIIELQAEAASS